MTDAPYADAALFGKDPTPRLLDVQSWQEGSEPALVRVYRRTPEGEVAHTDQRLWPFFFLSDARLLQGFSRRRFRFQPLAGDQFYRNVVVFETWADYWDALRHVERRLDARDRRPEELYRIPSPAQQYLTQTGQTLFKGMDFGDLHRLQLDIEVATDSGFPNASRPADAVIIVAISDNRGFQRLLHGLDYDEAALLRETLRVVGERDPDVIEGHNVMAFDLAYLEARCARYGIPFALGRDGSAPRSFPASMRFAERSIEYPAYEIAGRHVVDTLFQVMSYDVFKRDLPGYGLKAVAKYFGFAPPGRTYVEGSDIGRVWRDDPQKLLAYALDDVVETERLARHLSGSTFYLTQMLPMPYGQVARTGPAAKIEALFVREYLRQRASFPKAEWGSQAVGGYTDVFVTGAVGPIVYADVESLYPSIMLHYDVKPRGDTLGLFPSLLRRLTDLRFEAKAAMKAATDADERSSLDARQATYKILVNSFYGQLGFGMAAFNDFAEADRVATIGQDIVRQMMREIESRGGEVVEVDTDGVLFVPPPHVAGEAAERAFVDALTATMPPGIRIGFDGRFARMLSYKKKNYVLLGYDGALKFKGSSLVSRSIERFGRQYVREAVRLVLDRDVEGLHRLYLQYRDRILAHDWRDAESFARTETLKDPPDQYLADVAAGRRTRAAAYELAIAQARETGLAVRVGDRITYYVTGTAPGVTTYDNCRLAAAWNPLAPDENTAYYLKRLDEFSRKFEPFFTDTDFRLVFSPEDLFGFSAAGIALRVERRPRGTTDDVVPF